MSDESDELQEPLFRVQDHGKWFTTYSNQTPTTPEEAAALIAKAWEAAQRLPQRQYQPRVYVTFTEWSEAAREAGPDATELQIIARVYRRRAQRAGALKETDDAS